MIFLRRLTFGIQFLVFLLSFRSAIAGGRNDTDQQALLEFKAKITSDPFGIMSSWNTSIQFCKWQGVTCSSLHHQRVTSLILYSKQLHGSISPYLGNLSFLQDIQLQDNSFSNQIPQEIGRLRRLKILSMNDNLLTGQIPDNISACSNLIYILLSRNKLVGKIPQEFSSLSKLVWINLDFNNLTGGIPSFIGNFSSLESLSTNYNNLGGSIPETFGQLKRLIFLAMAGNMLSGTIPPSVYNMSSMSVFCMPENQLQGTLPSDLGNIFPNLSELNIGDNQFTGSIPHSMSNASNLERLTIALNGFTGEVPSLEKMQKLWWLSISTNHLGTGQAGDLNFLSTVSNATSLQLLAIHVNNFGGLLPSSITNFTSLMILALNYNKIFGSIPSGLGDLINLQMLHIGNNQLSGEIPEEIGKLQQLQDLSFPQNKFSGNIPSSLGNLTLLTQLKMQQNSLSGNIPSSLGNCQKLLLLDLSQNNLSGEIPKEVMSIPSLSIYMNLSRNNLTGSLPTEVGTLKNLGELDVSENMLTGEIPAILGSCVRLEVLHMQGNFVNGTIPMSLRSLKGLRVLDLSRNNLTGNIPEFLKDFNSLVTLNLSFNDFQGLVPIFKNYTETSLVGNSKLCGGIAEFQLPPCNFEASSTKGRWKLTKGILVAVSGLVCAILVLFVVFFLVCKWKRVAVAAVSSSSSENSHFNQSYRSLHKATDGFSSANLLGVGSFGSVYKGTLEEDGRVIAVKVLNLSRPGGSKSFKAECDVSRNVRHRNLVKLLSACSSLDYQGNDFKALIYEFMVHGSLDEWLHPVPESPESPRSYLNFLQRLSIAIDIANAIEYLHQYGSHTQIVHCDLKPSNVLLNAEMVGHVGDFGLARVLFPEAIHFHSTNYQYSSSIAVKGTIGYTAPEYGMGNGVSACGDMYSYGILLLEMFTGKRPTDVILRDGLNLHTYVKEVLLSGKKIQQVLDQNHVQEMKDQRSKQDEFDDRKCYIRTCHVEECDVVSILETGVACSAELPAERMNISEVAFRLRMIKEKLVINK